MLWLCSWGFLPRGLEIGVRNSTSKNFTSFPSVWELFCCSSFVLNVTVQWTECFHLIPVFRGQLHALAACCLALAHHHIITMLLKCLPLVTVLLGVACLLPGVHCQEKFSNQFKTSLKNLRRKIDFLGNVSSILDVGANNGDWSDLMKSKHFPNAEYFLIEGNAHYKDVFTKKGYSYEIALVGDKENEQVQFHFNPKYPTGGNIMNEKGAKPVRGDNVEHRTITTIDSILSRNQVKPPQLMKMDIQGAEFLALHGAKQTLKSVDVLIVEVAMHQYNPGAASFSDINFYLETQGFRIYDIADFRNERWVYSSMPGYKPVQTMVQADVIWAKESSHLFASSGFPKAPPSKYKCMYAPVAVN